MARRRRAEVRQILPDPKYGSTDLARFINYIMNSGKKTTAERIVYGALQNLEDQARRPGNEIFDQALRNVMPMLEVKSRRVGGATYQVPTEVKPNRRQALAMRWLITAARGRTGKPMADRLAAELLEASRGQGTAVKRKEDLHRMAEANRAFVHYRW
ncbi:MAG: 30S ribosomal protein S7 [SAR202 cluster bacterium]|nr:30S ribosomal protein S7 [SAR202 cluster bacterium]